MADSELNQVNEHYLEKIMDLSREKEVEASEDIYAANGMKLIAKGARLSTEMQERLILHRLTKPLETSISVNDGVGMKLIVAEAQRLVDEFPPLQALVGSPKGADSPLKVMARLNFNHSLLMLLSVAHHGGKDALEHYIVASLIAAGVARRLDLAEDRLNNVAAAGLFHDVGKLYINPEYLRPNQKLEPSEWRHVVSHPVIGQKLLTEVGGLNKATTLAVLQHHERYNGNGYPQQLAGSAVGVEGQVLAAAEILASMFMRHELSLARAELALRIVPGEHALPMISVLSGSSSEAQPPQLEEFAMQTSALAQERKTLLERLQALVAQSADLCAAPALQSAPAAALLRQVLSRLHLIQQALASTGVDYCADSQDFVLQSLGHKDGFEIHVVILEINWRLRELARDLILHSEHLAEAEQEALEPLIALLEEGGGASA